MSHFSLSEQEQIELEVFTDLAKRRLMEERYSPVQRLNAVLAGQKPDRIPFQLFGYSSGLIGQNLHDFFFDPIVRYKSTCAQIIRWGAVEVQNATRINSYRIGESLGSKLDYRENAAPATAEYVIKDPLEFDKLVIPDIEPFIEKDIWSLKNITQRFGDMIGPPCTFVYPPFSWVVTYLRQPDQLLMEIIDNPSFVHELCRFATDLELKVVKRLFEESGCGFFIPDGFCELLSPEQYEEFALPYTVELINSLPESLFYIPMPGKYTQITAVYDLLKDHKKLICMGSSINPSTPLKSIDDLRGFCEILNDLDRPFQIAIHQNILKMSSEQEIRNNVKELIEVAEGCNVLFRTDVVDPQTPPHNVDALVMAVREHGALL